MTKQQREAMERALAVLQVVEDYLPIQSLRDDVCDAIGDLQDALAVTKFKE